MSWTPLTPGTNNTLSSNTSLSAACGAVSVGDTINVAVTYGELSGTPSGSSVDDDIGNTYTLTTSVLDSTNGQFLDLWKSIVTTAGTPTVRVRYLPTPGTTAALNCSINVDPFSGSDASSASDGANSQKQTAPGTGTDAVTSGSFATSIDGCLIYGGCVETSTGNDPGSVGTGFSSAQVSGGVVLRTEYLVQGSAGSTAATLTTTAGSASFVTAGHAISPSSPIDKGTIISRFKTSHRPRPFAPGIAR